MIYLSLSFLSLICEIFEKLLAQQITNEINKLLSKYQYRFGQGCRAQRYVPVIIE